MTRQFAAHLRNPNTDEEFMVVMDSAEEAQAYKAPDGLDVDFIGPLGGFSSFPAGQLIRTHNWGAGPAFREYASVAPPLSRALCETGRGF